LKEDILVVIPARGGSKGLPGKNIKELAGKPLIHYSIEVARQLFPDQYICVSTDDEQIKKIAEQTGLKVPFLRPATLATDISSTQDVILHAVGFYEKSSKREFNKVVLLQPTSPFRTANHIEEALTMYNKEVDMVVSVKETKANPYFNLFESAGNDWIVKSKKAYFTNRQNCPKVYELNGSIYIMNLTSLKTKSISEFEKIKAFVMDSKYSVDIDNELDWKIAELILSNELI
jgi:N-acylneuraminate cytidylyltransferase